MTTSETKLTDEVKAMIGVGGANRKNRKYLGWSKTITPKEAKL